MFLIDILNILFAIKYRLQLNHRTDKIDYSRKDNESINQDSHISHKNELFTMC